MSKVACVQMTSGNNVSENLNEAKKLIQQAINQEAKLIVLPEMFCHMAMERKEKLIHRETLGHGLIQDFLQQQAQQHKVWIIGGTMPIEHDAKAYAACLVYNDQGERVAQYNKIHLFDVNVSQSGEAYAESASIVPGNEVVVIPTPIGKLGLAVCYDVRFPELFRQMTDKGAEVIALPSAFTYVTGVAHWDVLVRARAIENQVYLVAACQSGSHPAGRKTYGHSMIVNPWGEVQVCLATGKGVIAADINLNYLQKLRSEFPALTHRVL